MSEYAVMRSLIKRIVARLEDEDMDIDSKPF